jgi:hypothetical protein
MSLIARSQPREGITILHLGVTKIVTANAASRLFRIEHAHDGRGDLLPLAVLTCEFGPPFFREGVKTRLAVVLGSAPRGTDEAPLFEPLLLILVIGTIAMLIPMRRALRINPSSLLRTT